MGRKGVIIVFCTPMAAWLATGSTSSRQAKPSQGHSVELAMRRVEEDGWLVLVGTILVPL